MLVDYAIVLIFFALAAAFAVVTLFAAYLVRPARPEEEQKLSTYECGERPVGFSWVQFNLRFYVYALIFVIFDVETVFIVPWAVIFSDSTKGNISNLPGIFAFVEMMIFIGILLLGLAYAWKKGALEWT